MLIKRLRGMTHAFKNSPRVVQALGSLTDEEKEVLRLRFGIHPEGIHSLRDIALIVGRSRQSIANTEAKALTKLWKRIIDDAVVGLKAEEDEYRVSKLNRRADGTFGWRDRSGD